MKKVTAFLWALVLTISLFAQNDVEQLPWQQRDRLQMEPIPYEYQREADVMWSKNIWRMIDVRQKMNQPLAHPQQSLIQVLHEAAKRGDITVYDPAVLNADQLIKPLTREEVEVIGARRDTDWVISPIDGETEEMVVVENSLSWDKIIKYRVKEVWFFDTKTSSMKVRILAIAPVMEDYDAAGNYRGDMTMYWIPYAHIRDLLTKNEVFNPQNDTQHFSFDDMFEMRKFESYIYKESNVHDRAIAEYSTGIDAQIESDRIKQEIFEKEHDLWNY